MLIYSSIDDLAIFSSRPSFEDALHVGCPNFGKREKFFERINDIFDRKWLTNNGPCLIEFEAQIEDYIGVKHCIAITNATIALEILIRASELAGEVIIPSFTFVATAHALQWQEITPVFCDIDPNTHNLDPGQVEKLITPNTTGIIGVHIWGRPCKIESLDDIANKHGLRLLFDAAHAFGTSYKKKMVGNFGDAEVFSFHSTKFFNTFEGGAIVTNNDDLADKCRLMRNFGFVGQDAVNHVGTNGKMCEVSAAMGLTSFENLDFFIDTNKRNYFYYQNSLGDIPGIKLIEYNPQEECNYQYIVLEVDESRTGISRDLLIKILHAENILARRYFYPGCHNMEPYISYFPHAGLLLPETNNLAQRVLLLPNGTAVDEQKIQRISQTIRYVVDNSYGISQRLS